jgi:hypothetical protein
MGASPEVAQALARVVQSVAERLKDNNGEYETIDAERSWLDRNGGLVLSGLNVALGIASIVGCVACAIASAGISTYLAANACSDGLSSDCAMGVAGAALAWTGAGAAVGASLTKIASTAATTSANGLFAAAEGSVGISLIPFSVTERLALGGYQVEGVGRVLANVSGDLRVFGNAMTVLGIVLPVVPQR